MLLIYTGEGKGKTSAATGQCIRALGAGLRVGFAQFMKRDGQAGEQNILAQLLGEMFFAGGKGFFKKEADRADHQQAAAEVLAWATAALDQDLDMLILDELLYALGAGLLRQEDILALLKQTEQSNTHLVLTGRGLPDWLQQRADLVTEMLPVKHPFDKGIKAQRGIEF